MCELFGLSGNSPVGLTLSLREFARHGSPDRAPRDGWGIAYYHDRDVRLIKDTEPAATSDWMRFVEGHCLRSPLILSHIRHATQGGVRYANTQPFARELAGRKHVMAHNGDLDGIRDVSDLAPVRFRPVGDTDSEWAFCALLQRIAALWESGPRPPDLAARLQLVAAFARALRALGPANFLYCDGDALFVHADRRTQRGGGIAPPGLWSLERHCKGGKDEHPPIKGAALETRPQNVALIASVPLTNEVWRPLAHGEVLAMRGGAVAAATTLDGPGSTPGTGTSLNR